MRLRLSSPEGVREIELPSAGEFSLGRSAECSVRLSDPLASRRHAVIACSAGGWILSDAGSRGGTFVNGARIGEPVPLSPGDTIRMGGTTALVEADSTGDGSVAPSAGDAVKAPPSPFAAAFEDAMLLYSDEMMALKSRIHNLILSRIDTEGGNRKLIGDKGLSAKAESCLDTVLQEMSHELPDEVPVEKLRQSLLDELLGFGPISPLIRDRDISEIMVNGPDRIFIECGGRLRETGIRFFDERHLIQIIQRIVEPLGRHVDDASPMVDARLPDGSRVNAVVPPLALDGASLTIRKFPEKKLTTDDLIAFGSMTRDMALFLEEAVRARRNILVSGGTGSGKTTLLNILSQFIPEGERVVTVEDSAELKLSHRNIVRLEARPPNSEGKGRITIRDLVINCLRMRPDRIIVGECRGAEALDMLQAMNTGHDGSLTTAHANNPRDVLSRLENMVMMAGYDLPSSAIREQISSAVDLIVQQTRMGDGSRKVVKIVEVTGREGDVIQMQDIFEFRQTGLGEDGRILGDYQATGNIPYFIEERRRRNALSLDMSVFVPKI